MIQKIKKLVERETKIKNIGVRKRTQELVDARVFYFVLALRHTKYSYVRIGSLVNRDHSTVVHAQKIYTQWRQQPELFTAHLRTLQHLDDVLNGKKQTIEVNAATVDRLTDQLTLLKKEKQELLDTIDRQQEKIQQLKKYEPIW